MPKFVLSDGVNQGRDTIQALRYLNMQAEPTPQGPERFARFQRGRLDTPDMELGSGPIRAIFTFLGEEVVVSGSVVFYNGVNIGAIPSSGPARFAVSDEECVIVAGGFAHYITTTAVTVITDPDLFSVLDVIFLSGRFLYFSDGQTVGTNGQYAWSALNDAQTIDGIDFASAESQPDPIIGAIVQGERFGIAGSNTIEWWYPTLDINAPFQRSSGQTYSRGCVAIRSLVLADNAIWWLGNDRIFYRSGAVPQARSSYQVAQQIALVAEEDLPNVSCWTTTYNQHVFIVLNLPGVGTWAHDVANRSWCKWQSWGRDRFRVDFASEEHLGDFYSGKITKFTASPGLDLDEDPMERIVSAFIASNAGFVTMWNLHLRTLRGVGIEGDGFGSEPQVEMRYSDHDGTYWSNWLAAPLGMIGDTSVGAKAIWIQLGSIQAPGRLIEFRCTDPVDFAPYGGVFNEAQP